MVMEFNRGVVKRGVVLAKIDKLRVHHPRNAVKMYFEK